MESNSSNSNNKQSERREKKRKKTANTSKSKQSHNTQSTCNIFCFWGKNSKWNKWANINPNSVAVATLNDVHCTQEAARTHTHSAHTTRCRNFSVFGQICSNNQRRSRLVSVTFGRNRCWTRILIACVVVISSDLTSDEAEMSTMATMAMRQRNCEQIKSARGGEADGWNWRIWENVRMWERYERVGERSGKTKCRNNQTIQCGNWYAWRTNNLPSNSSCYDVVTERN